MLLDPDVPHHVAAALEQPLRIRRFGPLKKNRLTPRAKTATEKIES